MRVVLQNDNFLDTVCLPLPSLFLSLSLFFLSSISSSYSSPPISYRCRQERDAGQRTMANSLRGNWPLLLNGLFFFSARVTANLALVLLPPRYTTSSSELIIISMRNYFFYSFCSIVFLFVIIVGENVGNM